LVTVQLAGDEMEQLRQAVIELWDPIGVFRRSEGGDNFEWPRDEYDNYLPAIAAHLHRHDLDGLTAYLTRTRTDVMGMTSRLDQDRSAAQALTVWYERLHAEG
jgi:hypothetical protein